MTAPVPACIHCRVVPIVRTVQPAALRARAVTIELCPCDWPHCPNASCKRPVPLWADRCPHCNAA